MQWGICRNGECIEFSNLCHCNQHPLKLTSRDQWISWNDKKDTFYAKTLFWENAAEYLRHSECYSFPTFAIVFSTPWNLLVGITGALGTKESHFLSWNLFWENAVEYLRHSECYSFQTLAIVFSTPDNLLVGNYWSTRNKRKPLFKLETVFWENAVEYLRNSECYSL